MIITVITVHGIVAITVIDFGYYNMCIDLYRSIDRLRITISMIIYLCAYVVADIT